MQPNRQEFCRRPPTGWPPEGARSKLWLPAGSTHVFEELGDDTRNRIMAGAARAFVAQGIRATCVQDILQTSGFSRRTFYQYFTSKEGVMLALYESATGEMIKQVKRSVESQDHPVKQVASAIETYVDFQHQGGPVLIALQAEAICTDSPLSAHREDTLDQLVALVDSGVQAAIGQSCDLGVYRSVLMGIEALVIHTQRDGGFSTEDSDRVKSIGIPILLQVIAGVRSMPAAPESDH